MSLEDMEKLEKEVYWAIAHLKDTLNHLERNYKTIFTGINEALKQRRVQNER